MLNSTSNSHLAIVTRSPVGAGDNEQYAQLGAGGEIAWTSDAAAATAFESMREAMRFALRLPGSMRAFGLPLSGETASHRVH